MLYSIDDAMFLLGCFANKPSLLLSNKYKIGANDFKVKGCEEAQFHHILYRTMYNVVCKGATTIDEVVIDTFLRNYPEQYELCQKYDFLHFINRIKEVSESKNIEYYYNVVRKFSMLRTYKSQGFDISNIYDELKEPTDQRLKLDNMSLMDIDDFFEGKRLKIKQEFIVNEDVKYYKAGTDFEDTLEYLKQSPYYGLSFQSPVLNTICRGINGLTLRSGSSGGGKTILSVADCCINSIPYYFDEEQNDFVNNVSFRGNALFINTEMDLRIELDPMFIAWISGVPRYKILDGKFTVEEEKRIKKAREILQDSGIFLVDNPEFTTKSLEDIIEDHVLNKDVKLVCFDYCQNNNYVAAELSQQGKIAMREDMVLLTLTDRLKQFSRKYHIPILSGTQLNGQEYNMSHPTEACLAGGKSQIRKCDSCMIIMPVSQKDLCEIESYCMALEYKIQPNLITHIIKGRHTKFPKYIRLYSYVDLGTGRIKDLFTTDKDLSPIEIKGKILTYN